MTTVRQQLKNNGIEFGHIYSGKQEGENHPHRGDDRWDVSLSRPGESRPGYPTLHRGMGFYLWASGSESDAILRNDTSAGTRYTGVRLLEFQAVWKILNVAERVLRSHGDMRDWLAACGIHDPQFPMMDDEDSKRERSLSELYWHSRWNQEKHWTSELSMVLGGDDIVRDWINNTES